MYRHWSRLATMRLNSWLFVPTRLYIAPRKRAETRSVLQSGAPHWPHALNPANKAGLRSMMCGLHKYWGTKYDIIWDSIIWDSTKCQFGVCEFTPEIRHHSRLMAYAAKRLDRLPCRDAAPTTSLSRRVSGSCYTVE